MDLRHYLLIIWRRKWIIAAVTAGVLLMAAIGNSRAIPIYKSSATLRVAASMGMTQSLQFYTYNTQLMNTYVELASSRPVLAVLGERLQAQVPEIEAEIIPNTELIRITASSPDPKLAALAANTLAQILAEQSDNLYTGGSVSTSEILLKQVDQAAADLTDTRKEYESLIAQTPPANDQIVVAGQLLQEKQRTYEALLRQYEQAQYREVMEASMVTIVEEAIVPATPSEPRILLNYVLAALIGLFAGGMLAFLFENMDGQLHSTQEIEASAQIPTLAKLPKTSGRHLYISQNGTSRLAESVRHLAARLQMENVKPRHTVIALTGAQAGQGATTTVANLGVALAEQGMDVVIVDCNVRDPKLHHLFDLPNERGLTNILLGEAELKDVVNKVGDGHLTLLSTGPVTDSPLQSFDSACTESLIQNLRQQFDYVLIDTPALTVADIVAVAPHADELILVARRSHIQREAIKSAAEFLTRFDGKPVRLVVNESEG
ncbi:polysaccharide biosynthesis tyrosine autokinase [Chloroflexota bacterium]